MALNFIPDGQPKNISQRRPAPFTFQEGGGFQIEETGSGSSVKGIAQKVIYSAMGLTALGFTILWVRVVLECIVVIFNIATTLKATEQSIKVIEGASGGRV